MTAAAEHLHGFLAALTAAGVAAGTQKQVDFLRAVALAPPPSSRGLYWTARVTLVRRREEIEIFDRVFGAWFGDGAVALVPPAQRSAAREAAPPLRRSVIGDAGDAVDRREGAGRDASVDDVLGRCSFPRTTEQQHRLLADVERALAADLPATTARRRRPARRGDVLDLRRVLRAACRSGGDVLHLHWRDMPRRPRRLLLLVDVSGSLRESSGESLRFAHALVHAAPRTEVYTFGTQLTRVTKALRKPDVDAALDALADVVLDVNGGTRIGSALEEFLADARRSSAARDALVLVVSDGLERGDPRPMAAAVARLSRLAHRVVWWSPLACDPGYTPTTRAMAAVLDDLDDLAGVRDLSSALAAVRRLPSVAAGPRRAAARAWSPLATSGGRP
jgi:uncharacterized protein with von Willebrand factor type A (vWA) domain